MSQQLKESLSAVMDGEADQFEIRRVLDEAAQDSALRGVWERYHLARSVMRGEGRTLRRGELGHGFWARVDADAAAVPEDAPATASLVPDAAVPASRWNQRLIGVAVAAGMAAAVIIGLGRESQPGTPTNSAPVAIVTSADALSLPVAEVDETDGFVAQPSATDVQRARAYMLHHAQQVALTNQARVVQFVKVAAFESR